MINLIYNLLKAFNHPGAIESFRRAAIELLAIMKLDFTTEAELIRALLAGEVVDESTRAGFIRCLDILRSAGAVQYQDDPEKPDNFRIQFNARPLIDLLKQMPNRDAETGLSKGFINRHWPNYLKNEH